MNRMHVRAILLATSSLVLSGQAFGQTATPPKPAAAATDVTEIVVTARRIAERLQDVPISITVFNQDQLSRQNVTNSEDLAKFTPSLSANSTFGSDNSTFAIRGFVQDIGTAPSVGVYFADVVAPRGGSASFPTGDGAGAGSFFDLQNVQVLKGPQGTLFGRNTTGGAVLLVPQRPTYKFEGYAEGSVGNYDLRRLQAVVNVPVNDSVRLRVGLDRSVRDGWLTNTSGVGPSRFNDQDYWAGRASLVVDLAQDVENYTIVSYSKSDTNGPLQKMVGCNASAGLGFLSCAQFADVTAKGEGFYTARSDVTDPRSNLKTWQAINTTTWQATESLTIKNIASYGRLEQTLRAPLFGTQFMSPAIPALGLPSLPVSSSSIIPAPGRKTADQSTYTEEFQLQGRSGARFNWQAGAYLEVSRPEGVVGNQSPTLVSCTDSAALQCTDILGFLANLDPNVLPLVAGGIIAPVQVGSVNYTVSSIKTRDVGIYTQGSYSLTDQLKLTAGLRYTWDRQDSETAQISYRFPTFPYPAGPAIPVCARANTTLPDCALALKQRSSAPTWLLGLDYKPSDDLLLYVKYVRGYRTGGIKSDAPVKYSIFRPEKVDTYEAGFKSSFSQAMRATLNASVFYNDFSDQQLQAGYGDNPLVNGAVSPTAGPVNAGRSRIYGLESEASVRPFTGLTLSASYAYLNTKVRSVTPITLPANDPYTVSAEVFAGDKLALSPKHKLVISGSYRLPLDDSIGEILLGATYSYVSSQSSNFSTSPFRILPATNLLNLNIDWRSVAGSPVDLALFATNVTKEKYYTYVPGTYDTFGFEVASLGEPQMYGARLKVSF